MVEWKPGEHKTTGRTRRSSPSNKALFGEDQGRYLIACNFDQAEALMIAANAANLTLTTVGRAGGSDITFGHASAPLVELDQNYRTAFEHAVA